MGGASLFSIIDLYDIFMITYTVVTTLLPVFECQRAISESVNKCLVVGTKSLCMGFVSPVVRNG